MTNSLAYHLFWPMSPSQGMLGMLGKCVLGVLLVATVCIPAIYIVGGKRLTAYMISYMLPTVMKGIDVRFRDIRKELLRGLEGAFKSV